MTVASPIPVPGRFRTLALAALLAAFAVYGADLRHVSDHQPLGVDFMSLWAGASALADPERIYDFNHVTMLQGWPMGPDRLRPFAYPPSALLLLAPFGALPFWAACSAWIAATFALFAWAGRRVGAPLWIALFPVVWLVAIVGQVTFLIGGLAAAALTLRHRPILAGVLWGVAAAIKPQMLVFAPLALVADGRWRSLFAAAVSGLALCLASVALWGPGLWLDWLAALPRFQALIRTDAGLAGDVITPYGLLATLGLPGAWAFALAPVAAWLVWTTFRTTQSAPDRLIAVFASALLVSPYALHYEAALLAPAVAAYLARTEDRRWPLYAVVACVYTLGMLAGFTSVAMALVLLLAARIPDRPLALAPRAT